MTEINNERSDTMIPNPSTSDLTKEPAAVVQHAMDNVIQYKAIRPNWKIDPAGNPAWKFAAYKYTDNDEPGLCTSIPPAAFSNEFRLTAGLVEPGRGAPLHDHSGEELMFVAEGSFVVFFDEEERHKVFLEKWDAILVPANVVRGWRNVGHGPGYFLNFSGTHDRLTTIG